MFSRSFRARCEVVASAERACGDRIDVGQARCRSPARRSDRGALARTTTSAGSMMRRRSRSSASPAAVVRADQIFAALCDLGLGLKQIERRRLADIDARLVLAHQLLGQLERPLLHRDVGERRLECPIRLFHGRSRLDYRLAHDAARSFRRFRCATMVCCRARSILRSFSSGCENAS